MKASPEKKKSRISTPPAALERGMASPDHLRAHPRNARKHTDEQVAQIAGLIQRFGFTAPVIIDGDGQIIAGHGRVAAARLLGLKSIPTVVAKGWSAEEIRAYMLADNQVGLNSSWDGALLADELGGLRDLGFDPAMLGFSPAAFAKALQGGHAGATDPDETPEVQPIPVARRGDVWLLGQHRVVCGDCCDAETVAKVLAGDHPTLMVTDPPYGVRYDPTFRVAEGQRKRQARGDGGKAFHAGGKVLNDDRADWRAAWALFPGAAVYCWSASLTSTVTFDSLRADGFEIRSQIVWDKGHFALSRGDYHWQHEVCWYGVRAGQKSGWQQRRDQATVWKITGGIGWTSKTEGEDARTGHSTQKPVECMRRPMENSSAPGSIVYDPFLGSGSSVIAAQMTGRQLRGCELNPAYVDVIVRRWQTFTSSEATLEGTRKSFKQVEAERAK